MTVIEQPFIVVWRAALRRRIILAIQLFWCSYELLLASQVLTHTQEFLWTRSNAGAVVEPRDQGSDVWVRKYEGQFSEGAIAALRAGQRGLGPATTSTLPYTAVWCVRACVPCSCLIEYAVVSFRISCSATTTL